jgi:hypothetical protein
LKIQDFPFGQAGDLGVPPLKWSGWRVLMSPFSGGPENGRETTEAGGDRLKASPG